MGGPPPAGGGMGGDPLGGGMGAPPGGGAPGGAGQQPVIPSHADVWEVLDTILNHKPGAGGGKQGQGQDQLGGPPQQPPAGPPGFGGMPPQQAPPAGMGNPAGPMGMGGPPGGSALMM